MPNKPRPKHRPKVGKTNVQPLSKLAPSKKFSWWQVALVAVPLGAIGVYLAFSTFAVTVRHTNFLDVSSPQCGSRIRQIANYSFGIVGLNGSKENFNTNPCLIEETRHFRGYDLYVGANYPSAGCRARRAYSATQCGIEAGRYNVSLIKNFRLRPGTLWIDVENPGKDWGSSQADNRAFLSAMKQHMHSAGYPVSYYSTADQWNRITGGMKTGVGNWYSIGRSTRATAASACRDSRKRFGGGTNQYMQYWQQVYPGVDQDYNIHC